MRFMRFMRSRLGSLPMRRERVQSPFVLLCSVDFVTVDIDERLSVPCKAYEKDKAKSDSGSRGHAPKS